MLLEIIKKNPHYCIWNCCLLLYWDLSIVSNRNKGVCRLNLGSYKVVIYKI